MIFKNISLKKYNTFGLGYKAENLIIIKSEEEAISTIKSLSSLKNPIFILGGGSNILFTSDFSGTIIHPEIPGIEIEEQRNDKVIVSAGAGVKWDDFVEWAVNNNLGGVENLSFIPGSTGATPVQNIGAYGAEVKETILKVRTIALKDGTFKDFLNEECRFGYRYSAFKNELKGKYLITKVYYELTTRHEFRTAYGSLKEEIDKLGPVSLQTIRKAVINIRKAKLPDPSITGNAGSFFKNPLVSSADAAVLINVYPQMPQYSDPSGGTKLAAGWLIEQCGWKGKRIGDAAVHDKQALVLVNYGKATGVQISELSDMIRKSVHEKFGVILQSEVEVL
jgi:UDP-N-acetylmuramate dehydrogenase